MSYTLGVDIGTFETKGVLVDGAGVIVATATRAKFLALPVWPVTGKTNWWI